jgi:hypothetical protein
VTGGHRRRRGWLLAGGIVGGLALAPRARRAGLDLRARALRLGRPAADPVAPFRQAPCYEHDRTVSGDPSRTEAAR